MGLLGLGILFLSFSVIKTFTPPENPGKRTQIQYLLFSALQQAHFNTISLDDEFSQNGFDSYLKKLDPNKRFFYREDSVELSVYHDELDDAIKGGLESPLYKKPTSIFDQRVVEAEKICNEI